MASGLKGTSNISVRCKDLYAENITGSKIQSDSAIISVAAIGKIINPEFACLRKKFNSMFIQSDVSGCIVSDLSPYFKHLICQTVNECPYYNDYVIEPQKIVRGFENDLNLSDNSFFHEEIIDDSDILSNDGSIVIKSENPDKINNINDYSTFISKNLSIDANLINNNLKIISIDKISKGKWLFNGNISIEIPSMTFVSNIKLFAYLDDDVVPSGEIDFGSHTQTGTNTLKSHSFNLMFKNDLEGSELKIGIITFDNQNKIKLLKTTNFFANKM